MCFLNFFNSGPLTFLNMLKPSSLYNPIFLESYFVHSNDNKNMPMSSHISAPSHLHTEKQEKT